MLKRKIENQIRNHFEESNDRILIVEGARQVGKTYIIRHVCQQLFKNYIEINLANDKNDKCLFEGVRNTTDFYLQVSTIAGSKMGSKEDTLIFLDEIQEYEHLLTMLKFLREDGRYTYIASGSLLGVTLKMTTSIPIGSISLIQMYPLDFEEFLYANGFNELVIDNIRNEMISNTNPRESVHIRMMDLFKKYMISGGLPAAVNAFINDNNVVKVRDIQNETHSFYKDDASKYEKDHHKKLKIRAVYDMIPSNMENKKKRIVAKAIEGKKGKRFTDYEEEFDYLIAAGVALNVQAIPTPVFPLVQSISKNLVKMYLNDVGILSNILYKNNIRAILDENRSINMGSLYESVVAQELKAHGHNLFYYDNRNKGEVDFLIDNYDSLSVLPIEVKSGKDYTVHSALDNFLKNPDYNVKEGIVLSNTSERKVKKGIRYLPIYDVMFL